CPHGVYPALGDDQWVALACPTDEHWQSLCQLMDRTDLAADPALATLDGRRARVDDLDKVVAEWTAAHTAPETADRCQAAGIPAHAVHDSPACWEDPQLAHRGHFVALDHPEAGPITLEGSRIRLSRTPARVGIPPLLGHDMPYVLGELLGYDEERIGDLYAA